MPRQIPITGFPSDAASRIVVSRPRCLSAVMPAPNAPTPGSTTRDATRTALASAVTDAVMPRRRNAPAIDARLATPESTMTTSVTSSSLQSAFGRGHVVESRARDRLAERQRGRLERRFGAMMIVLALEDIDVQRNAGGCRK